MQNVYKSIITVIKCLGISNPQRGQTVTQNTTNYCFQTFSPQNRSWQLWQVPLLIHRYQSLQWKASIGCEGQQRQWIYPWTSQKVECLGDTWTKICHYNQCLCLKSTAVSDWMKTKLSVSIKLSCQVRCLLLLNSLPVLYVNTSLTKGHCMM